jgi:multicomponent K+:H+ antiporter subunit A
MDGFAWVMAALVTGIGFLVVLYSRYYMSPADSVPRFFSFLLAFMGAMLGIVLSGNLIQLVFFWESASVFSLRSMLPKRGSGSSTRTVYMSFFT